MFELKRRTVLSFAGNTLEVTLILHDIRLNSFGVKVNGFIMNYSFVTAVSKLNQLHSIQFICMRTVYVVPISVKIF
jgi:hypothetical protein